VIAAFETLSAPYMQRALVEILLLAVLAGALGRMDRAAPAGVLHALGGHRPRSRASWWPARGGSRRRSPRWPPRSASRARASGSPRGDDEDAATGILLVGALALGALLASDVYHSGAGVDRLLFGTLIGPLGTDLALTALAAVGALAAGAVLRRAWLARAFDPDGVRALGVAVTGPERVLLAAVAAAVIVALAAVGALLVSVVLVVPAATVRLVARDLRALQLGTGALAAVEGLAALWLADATNVSPGPSMAIVAGAVFAVVAVATRRRWV
jgi:ABC-type Mn2+/Zn2+ transport system permease subunit